MAQPALSGDYLGPHLEQMQTADVFEREIYRWAVNQLVPLSLLKSGQALVAFFEDLVRCPAEHLPVLLGYTRTPDVQAALAHVRRPSALVLRSTSTLAATKTLSEWRQVLSPSELRRADDILRRFGLDVLYSTDDDLPKPRTLAAARFPCLDFYPGQAGSPSLR